MPPQLRVTALGKSFLLDGSPFRFRGVRYALDAQSAEQALDRLGDDLAAIAACGYTVVSLRGLPESAIQTAVESGLRFMLELDCVELVEIAAAPRRERRRLLRELAVRVRRAAGQWDGDDALLGVALGLPSAMDQSRKGADRARRAANELAAALHDEEPELLAAWGSGAPLEWEWLPEFDYLIASFQVRRGQDLVAALMNCHGHIGDRPLVLGGVSDADSVPGKDDEMAWMIDAALRCGAAGIVGSAWWPAEATRQSSQTAELNQRTVRDLDVEWPAISVVVNTYNAQDTLDECLRHCDRLEYPRLEVIVVDDGSTDASRAIACAHPRVRLVAMAHKGLPEGRNVGYRSARGELVAYLDADAYPAPEWPWYLALAAGGTRVGGSGGPNIPPPDLPASARIAARSPGSPVPQLLDPGRARHVPGCNMALWRHVLDELDGFDSALEGAEDLEFEWRLGDCGYEIGYHPAALVWHRRRPGIAAYLRQQSNYGRHYAMLERRYPERFPRGYRLRNAARRLRASRSGAESSPLYPVRYLTLPRPEGPILEMAHQWGMPLAFGLAFTGPLGLAHRTLAAPAAAAGACTAALFAIDVRLAAEGRRRSERTLGFTARVALFRLLRPLAFRWGHLMGWLEFRRATPDWPPRPAEVTRESPPRRAAPRSA
jgi:GT2 family glycosyltransferase